MRPTFRFAAIALAIALAGGAPASADVAAITVKSSTPLGDFDGFSYQEVVMDVEGSVPRGGGVTGAYTVEATIHYPTNGSNGLGIAEPRHVPGPVILQGIGTNALPARQGQFATDVHMIEMAVKDSGRVPEGWAYYAFGGPMMGGYRTAAAPQGKASCYDCHVKHAARDNVFTQFYGLLNEAAPRAK